MRQIPIDLRHFPMDPMRGMRPMNQEPPRPELPQISIMYQQQAEQVPNSYNQEQQGPIMMPPPPPPQAEAQIQEQRIPQPPMMIPQTEQRPPAPQAEPEKPRSPFQGIPIEIRRIIQQVPLEIKNIIQHITGEARPFPVQVPEGARREVNALTCLTCLRKNIFRTPVSSPLWMKFNKVLSRCRNSSRSQKAHVRYH